MPRFSAEGPPQSCAGPDSAARPQSVARASRATTRAAVFSARDRYWDDAACANACDDGAQSGTGIFLRRADSLRKACDKDDPARKTSFPDATMYRDLEL